MGNAIYHHTTSFKKIRNIRHYDTSFDRTKGTYYNTGGGTTYEDKWYWSDKTLNTSGRTRNTTIESNYDIYNLSGFLWFSKTTSVEQDSESYQKWSQFDVPTDDYLISPELSSLYPYQCLINFFGFGTYIVYMSESIIELDVAAGNLLKSDTGIWASIWQYGTVPIISEEWNRVNT